MVKRLLLARALTAAGLTLGFGAANAADPIGSIARIEGVAVVSQGAQYVKAREGMSLKEGDRLMVLEGGSAVIAFIDGCQYNLTDSEVMTIGTKSSCASAASGSYKVDPYSAVSKGPGAAAQHFQPAATGSPPAMGASWVIPVTIVGGLAILGATLDTGSDDRDDTPAPSRPAPSP